MIIQPKNIVLKNGRKATIRSFDLKDAKTSIDLNLNMSQTTEYMMKYPEEVSIDLDREREAIQSAMDAEGMCYLGCFIDDKLVGSFGLYPVGHRMRTIHRCAIGAGVHSEYRGMGIGSILLGEIISIAKAYGYEQMELDVVSENKAGIALYTSYGFVKTGIIPHSFKMKNGKYYDFDIMVLDLLKDCVK